MKVLFWPELSKSLREMAERYCPAGIELEWLPREADDSEVIARLRAVDCLFSHASGPLSAKIYPELEHVKLFQLLSAGYDFLDIGQARAHNVLVCNNGGANAIAVAEHAVLLMLAVLRKLTVRDAALRLGQAERDATESFELAGRTVGLVGFGFIGRQVAQRLKGFDVSLRYHDIERASKETEASFDISYRSLPDLLSECDVVSLHAPLNDRTRNLINRETLSMVKPNAVLINTARGELVDEQALADALRRGALLGAGLDVFALEPPRTDNPLLDPSLRVVATPHSAGPTWESFPRRIQNAFANAQRVQRGEAPQWVIPELR